MCTEFLLAFGTPREEYQFQYQFFLAALSVPESGVERYVHLELILSIRVLAETGTGSGTKHAATCTPVA